MTVISDRTGWSRKCCWENAITQTTRTSLYTPWDMLLQISVHECKHTHGGTKCVCPSLFLDLVHLSLSFFLFFLLRFFFYLKTSWFLTAVNIDLHIICLFWGNSFAFSPRIERSGNTQLESKHFEPSRSKDKNMTTFY